MNKVLLGIIAIVIVVVAVMMINGNNTSTQDQASQPTPTPQVSIQEGQAKVEDVEVTAEGYVPQSIIIKAGTKVVWTNKTGTPVTVDSAPHPTHTTYLPLNLGQFEDGQSVELVFDKSGVYKYHNHLNPSQFGSITVE